MNLTKEQIAQFDKYGYLFFPNLFSKEEVQNLSAEVPKLYDIREEYNYREKDSDLVRTNFAAHLYSKPFAKLARHPRMINPVEDLLKEKLYMHQFKINGKMAFEGDVCVNENGRMAEIIWLNEGACFDFIAMNAIGDNYGYSAQMFKYKIAIIGNIHENPELIGESK